MLGLGAVEVVPFDPAANRKAGEVWTDAEGKRRAMLSSAFVNALEMSALDHMRMGAAVQPFVDTAISKTVNVPVDYPFDKFADLYVEAWKAGLKGITTYRPNDVLGSVLEVASPLKAIALRVGAGLFAGLFIGIALAAFRHLRRGLNLARPPAARSLAQTR